MTGLSQTPTSPVAGLPRVASGPAPGRIPTGSTELDEILRGGLPVNRMYLLEGTPGAGKTTLALQFLRQGVLAGERVLYITLSETCEELNLVAESHGWTMDGIDVLELSAIEEAVGSGRDQSILHSWELELNETVALIRGQVEKVQPRRVVFDSLSEMRLLSQDMLLYRRQVLSLKQFFTGKQATVFLVDDLSGLNEGQDPHVHSICHGVITLERLTLDFGAARRRLQVQKLRGVDFVAGYHDFTIRRGGLCIYPRLIASNHHTAFVGSVTPSGVAALDELMNGGPLRGTTTLITGPAGTGKTTITLQYLYAACERGETATIYQFDERVGTLLARAGALGLDLGRHMRSGLLKVEQIDPAELSPGEFTHRLVQDAEVRNVRMIAIDSLSGYLAAMPQEKQLILQVHELLSYLNQRGTVTFLINPQEGVMGSMHTRLAISYVSDAVILLRFFEAEGRIRKAISVLKNRAGWHDDMIRELRINQTGVCVGEPLRIFRGVLTGTPEYVGDSSALLEDSHGG